MSNELVVIPLMGRPTDYTDELGDKIADLIASDHTLRQIESLEGMPSKSTICRWLGKFETFKTKCAGAREVQADVIDDRHGEIINKTESGELEPDVARVILSGLEWRAAKKDPKKYGNNKHIDINNRGTIVHLTGDLSSTLSFLGGDGSERQQRSGGDIQESLPDRPVLAAEIRAEPSVRPE